MIAIRGTNKRIVTGATGKRVGAGATCQHVVPSVAGERIGKVGADHILDVEQGVDVAAAGCSARFEVCDHALTRCGVVDRVDSSAAVDRVRIASGRGRRCASRVQGLGLSEIKLAAKDGDFVNRACKILFDASVGLVSRRPAIRANDDRLRVARTARARSESAGVRIGIDEFAIDEQLHAAVAKGESKVVPFVRCNAVVVNGVAVGGALQPHN